MAKVLSNNGNNFSMPKMPWGNNSGNNFSMPKMPWSSNNGSNKTMPMMPSMQAPIAIPKMNPAMTQAAPSNQATYGQMQQLILQQQAQQQAFFQQLMALRSPQGVATAQTLPATKVAPAAK